MNTKPTPLVVIVEDEVELAKLMANYLSEAGLRTQLFHRAQQALQFMEGNFANLLLLDITLPDVSGFGLLKALRERKIQIPVIFVTGNSLETSKVQGLNMGGDDYITKPFSYPELVARVRAVLRRAENNTDLSLTQNTSLSDEPFDFAGAIVEPGNLTITMRAEAPKKIGRKEIGIMAYLKANEGEVISRKALIHSVWGQHANVRSRSLDQYIVKVREYCRSSTTGTDSLRTVHGIGYIFDPDGKYRDTAS